jgi:hypothetical protein
MSFPRRLTSLLTSLTPDQIGALPPIDRQLLADQCERVYRMITSEAIVADRKEASAQPETGGVLALLKRGDRSL